MGNLFGIRRRAPLVTAQDRAVLQLKQQRDRIKIYQKRTEADLEKNKDLALKLFQSGFKDRALIVLRRKKCMEEVLSRTDRQLETLEQLVTDLEYTQIEVSVVEGLKVGTEALKQLNSLMSIDDIQQMMEDNEEAAEKQREISEILQKSSERYDEDELLSWLEGYKQPPDKVAETSEMDDAKKQNDVEAIEPEPETPQVLEPTIQPPKESGEVAIESIIDELPDAPKDLPKEEVETKKAKQKETRQLEPAQ